MADALFVPGNVRELRTAIEHAVCCAAGKKSRRAICRRQCGRRAIRNLAPSLARNEFDGKRSGEQLIIRALKETDGNRTLAAEKIGMSRRTFHRKLHLYHLEGF